MSFLDKIFGNSNEKYVKSLSSVIEKINSLEKDFENLSDLELKEKTKELKEELRQGKTLDDILPEAFALTREASKRTLSQRHFDVQLIGGVVLHQGKIAEMKTGEGKTLVATLPVYLNGLSGKGVHIITINDYLAKRDAVWMGQIYDALGLSVGCIMHEASYLYDSNYSQKDEERDIKGSFKVIESFLRPVSRKEAYSADITYGTNNEFGFDYLRDNMAQRKEDQAQRGYNFAIVDEVDSILIDEARTPLIISGATDESTDKYLQFSIVVSNLKEKEDFEIDEKMRTTIFTEQGQSKIVKSLGKDPWAENDIQTTHQLEAALKAKTLFEKDKDYVVKDGQIIIVDEFTGRLLFGRRYSEGLHQAIEAKERVKIQPESKTYATITFQNYFKMYSKLAGMTGTALTSAEEFDKVYKLEVISVPTNKKMIRQDLPDRIYKNLKGKFEAVVREISERHKKGQPVLVGTVSIERNEYLGKLLEREGIPHQILNAKHHEKEGEIIAQAGRFGAVTIATNMAGRGVDIILGGNPPVLEEGEKVKAAGGLCVIGTERHEARRIDNQLRGRAGRQGDSGSSQFFVSLEDDLMRIFGGDRIKSLMEMFKIPDDQPIEAGIVSKSIESSQFKVEGFHFDSRKHVLEYDDVMSKHRQVFYKRRQKILEKDNIQEDVLEIIKKSGYSQEEYDKKEAEIGKDNMRRFEKLVCLQVLDTFWMEHLENMEQLRDSVRLRSYGNKDPLIEYKTEGHMMFRRLLDDIDINIANAIFQARMQNSQRKDLQLKKENKEAQFGGMSDTRQTENRARTVLARTSEKKVGRNDPCHCGSGRKFKKCHGK